ncbi:MAG: hypothetical protein V4671_21365 [Armatimonadota bacterium]
MRRSLALTTVLCLLIGLMTIPRGPLLVCRITGVPMPPVVVTATGQKDSCCDIAASLEIDGTVRYSLAAPGCCDLRQDSDPAPISATPSAGVEWSVAVLSVPHALPVPTLVTVTVQTHLMCESAPRAPPLSSASPRAPPFVS